MEKDVYNVEKYESYVIKLGFGDGDTGVMRWVERHPAVDNPRESDAIAEVVSIVMSMIEDHFGDDGIVEKCFELYEKGYYKDLLYFYNEVGGSIDEEPWPVKIDYYNSRGEQKVIV